jgi:hypothetical protein
MTEVLNTGGMALAGETCLSATLSPTNLAEIENLLPRGEN